tara:strand:- start:729 stop:995 length:267 start_codon:yes stop_codon:yes gene_type:complete
MEATEKILKARHDAYRERMDKFTMPRYTAAMESLNATLEATLQDNDMTGILSVDCVSHTAAILAAADMLADKLDSIDRSIFELEMALT